jgi:hypothetical protein
VRDLVDRHGLDAPLEEERERGLGERLRPLLAVLVTPTARRAGRLSATRWSAFFRVVSRESAFVLDNFDPLIQKRDQVVTFCPMRAMLGGR